MKNREGGKADTPPDLTPKEIGRWLHEANKQDPNVVDDVLVFVEKQLTVEDAFSSKLDARATSLLGVAGFSMTLAFSFGGWALLDKARGVPSGTAMAWTFLVVLIIGLVTSVFALRGLQLRDGLMSIDEREVLPNDIQKTRVDFRINLASHLWQIWQARKERNDARAKKIRAGQWWFVGFLAAVLFLSGLTTWSAIAPRPAREIDDPLVGALVEWLHEDISAKKVAASSPHQEKDDTSPKARSVSQPSRGVGSGATISPDTSRSRSLPDGATP